MPNSVSGDHEQSVVYIVDDDVGFRRILESLLRTVQLRVESFGSADEFLVNYDPDRAGCVVSDVRMPGMSGLELQERLAARHVALPVIVMTGYAEVSLAVRALKSGARDFLEKPFCGQDLLDKIQRALDESRRFRRQQAEQAEVRARLQSLSPRERQLLNLLIAGKTTKQIARKLNVGMSTVDFHKRNVLEKMGVDNVVKLVRLIDTYLLARPDDLPGLLECQDGQL